MEATLSICMIVRDEAELLPRFIEAIEGLWDEWIVVDTGSTDATVSIATEAGAKVLHAAWTGDFAAARNVGLQAATSDWVLVLDADEFVSEAGVRELRAVIEDESVGAALIPMRNPLPHGHVRVTPLLRLFRNAPEILFRYPIHEDVTESVKGYLDRSGTRAVTLHEQIEHIGYVQTRAVAKDKKERDTTILRACIERDETDWYSWYKLLSLAVFWSDDAMRAEVAEDVAARLRAAGPEVLEGAHYAGELVSMLTSALYDRQPRVAADYMNTWGAIAGGQAEFHLRRGLYRERAGELALAVADYEACMAPETRTYNEQMATVRPLLGLARVALARGRLDDATERIEAALNHQPRDPEALLAAATLYQAKSLTASLDGFASDYVAAFGEQPELFVTLAELSVDQGRPAAARRYLERPIVDAESARVRMLMARTLLLEGDLGGCREACMDLFDADPRAGLGVLVCDLTEGQPTTLQIDLDMETANRAMRLWVDTLLRTTQQGLIVEFATYCGAVAQLFPWIGAVMHAGLRKVA